MTTHPVRSKLFTRLGTLLRTISAPVRWIRDGESDLDGTYPDRRKPTGPEAATQGSVTTNLTGFGNG